MGSFGRGAVSGAGILLLIPGIPALMLGLILRETGLFATVLMVGGGYVCLQGVMLILEGWIAGRSGR